MLLPITTVVTLRESLKLLNASPFASLLLSAIAATALGEDIVAWATLDDNRDTEDNINPIRRKDRIFLEYNKFEKS